jgi:Tfp pilus assembly protein PilF
MTSKAIEHWKMALQVAPNHLQSLYNLARTLAKLRDPAAPEYQQRFNDLEKTQQIADRVEQLGNLALEAANAQNWPQAIDEMKEAIGLCNQCVDGAHLHRNLGLFYFRTGKINDAQEELQKAIELDPQDGDAQKALALLQKLREPQIQ